MAGTAVLTRAVPGLLVRQAGADPGVRHPEADPGRPWVRSEMRLSFGIKTSQMGLTYQDILRVWRDADQVPVFGQAWLWDPAQWLADEVAAQLTRV